MRAGDTNGAVLTVGALRRQGDGASVVESFLDRPEASDEVLPCRLRLEAETAVEAFVIRSAVASGSVRSRHLRRVRREGIFVAGGPIEFRRLRRVPLRKPRAPNRRLRAFALEEDGIAVALWVVAQRRRIQSFQRSGREQACAAEANGMDLLEDHGSREKTDADERRARTVVLGEVEAPVLADDPETVHSALVVDRRLPTEGHGGPREALNRTWQALRDRRRRTDRHHERRSPQPLVLHGRGVDLKPGRRVAQIISNGRIMKLAQDGEKKLLVGHVGALRSPPLQAPWLDEALLRKGDVVVPDQQLRRHRVDVTQCRAMLVNMYLDGLVEAVGRGAAAAGMPSFKISVSHGLPNPRLPVVCLLLVVGRERDGAIVGAEHEAVQEGLHVGQAVEAAANRCVSDGVLQVGGGGHDRSPLLPRHGAVLGRLHFAEPWRARSSVLVRGDNQDVAEEPGPVLRSVPLLAAVLLELGPSLGDLRQAVKRPFGKELASRSHKRGRQLRRLAIRQSLQQMPQLVEQCAIVSFPCGLVGRFGRFRDALDDHLQRSREAAQLVLQMFLRVGLQHVLELEGGLAHFLEKQQVAWQPLDGSNHERVNGFPTRQHVAQSRKRISHCRGSVQQPLGRRVVVPHEAAIQMQHVFQLKKGDHEALRAVKGVVDALDRLLGRRRRRLVGAGLRENLPVAELLEQREVERNQGPSRGRNGGQARVASDELHHGGVHFVVDATEEIRHLHQRPNVVVLRQDRLVDEAPQHHNLPVSSHQIILQMRNLALLGLLAVPALPHGVPEVLAQRVGQLEAVFVLEGAERLDDLALRHGRHGTMHRGHCGVQVIQGAVTHVVVAVVPGVLGLRWRFLLGLVDAAVEGAVARVSPSRSDVHAADLLALDLGLARADAEGVLQDVHRGVLLLLRHQQLLEAPVELVEGHGPVDPQAGTKLGHQPFPPVHDHGAPWRGGREGPLPPQLRDPQRGRARLRLLRRRVVLRVDRDGGGRAERREEEAPVVVAHELLDLGDLWQLGEGCLEQVVRAVPPVAAGRRGVLAAEADLDGFADRSDL
mmetsp:Transcript_19475/g.73618  ORF Transcript_19475/g.73618 Transcript_19475/m.73618 type:complete len:1051 (+) Transcript_19475:2445-5597(+)